MTPKSTHEDAKGKVNKPPKPRPDFPLYPHLSGKWAKTVRGKTYYFGTWDDPYGAEREYLAVADDLRAGRTPRDKASDDAVTLRDACNRFIKSKKTKLETDNLSPRTFVQYDTTCRMLLDVFGRQRDVADLGPGDFERLYKIMAKKYSVTSLGSQITQVRSVFKFAYESDLIDKPVKYGPTFKAPSATEVRRAKAKQKNENGSRAFQPEEITAMLNTAKPQLRAMILLGINGGLGNTDCSALPLSALDLDGGWLDYPRQKTGVDRRIPLLPETVDALRQVIAERKEPHSTDDKGIVFVTLFGQRWVRYTIIEETSYGKSRVTPKQDDAISKATASLLKNLGLKRPGLSFYSLRHTFETIAGGSRDQVAVDAIMGHIDSSMAANYRHGIEDERLRAVVNHVRDWLFGNSNSQRHTDDQQQPQPNSFRIVG